MLTTVRKYQRKMKLVWLIIRSQGVMIATERGAGLLMDVPADEAEQMFGKLAGNLKHMLQVAKEGFEEEIAKDPTIVKKTTKAKEKK